MKKIINGKKYDTETATQVASWSNGLSYSDFGWCAESLYRKRTGEFFIHGESGPAGKYAEQYGNTWCFGELIRPLTEEEAMRWTERHCTGDVYEEIFGPVAE